MIKKHFSLFMVKKSIKKSSKATCIGELSMERQKISEFVMKVPRFLDPHHCFHLYGDIFFIDKLYDDDICLLSPSNSFRAVGNLNYDQQYNLWTINFLSTFFVFDSWVAVYERLITMGDKNAYELATSIDKMFISNNNTSRQLKEPSAIMSLASSINYDRYCKEIDEVLMEKKDTFYIILQYEFESIERGMIMKKMGFSKKFVDLIWGEESIFINLVLNHEMNDFISIEKENFRYCLT